MILQITIGTFLQFAFRQLQSQLLPRNRPPIDIRDFQESLTPEIVFETIRDFRRILRLDLTCLYARHSRIAGRGSSRIFPARKEIVEDVEGTRRTLFQKAINFYLDDLNEHLRAISKIREEKDNNREKITRNRNEKKKRKKVLPAIIRDCRYIGRIKRAGYRDGTILTGAHSAALSQINS